MSLQLEIKKVFQEGRGYLIFLSVFALIIVAFYIAWLWITPQGYFLKNKTTTSRVVYFGN